MKVNSTALPRKSDSCTRLPSESRRVKSRAGCGGVARDGASSLAGRAVAAAVAEPGPLPAELAPHPDTPASRPAAATAMSPRWTTALATRSRTRTVLASYLTSERRTLQFQIGAVPSSPGFWVFQKMGEPGAGPAPKSRSIECTITRGGASDWQWAQHIAGATPWRSWPTANAGSASSFGFCEPKPRLWRSRSRCGGSPVRNFQPGPAPLRRAHAFRRATVSRPGVRAIEYRKMSPPTRPPKNLWIEPRLWVTVADSAGARLETKVRRIFLSLTRSS